MEDYDNITKNKNQEEKIQKMKNKQEGDKIPLFNEKIINRKVVRPATRFRTEKYGSHHEKTRQHARFY
jgi:cellulose biosynthesis protein BcsQ